MSHALASGTEAVEAARGSVGDLAVRLVGAREHAERQPADPARLALLAPDATAEAVLLAVALEPRTERPARVGYARTSAAWQGLASQLEPFTGPLSGIYDPGGMGAMFFAALAAAQIERNYIREKTLEGQVTTDAKGNRGGRPKVIDDDMLLFARALKDRGVPVPEIAKKLTIKTGKNASQHPSVYRALAEAEATEAPAGPEIIAPRRPTRVDLTGLGSSTEPELVERLTRQVLDGTSDEVTDALAEQTGDGTKDVVAQLLAQARNGGEGE
ncbi:hypothetical protein [Streptomyces sp. DH37]|uniref:hypothetical protein n=1 Tax=Streptomyces sp. DH37 TaxID=3040122 RepID=UPI0024426CFA|nr:hypothetical protein [Streptomyces sp. DH37]MDG9702601.1 hypothetical protein [Streptomyces sp. DH37]